LLPSTNNCQEVQVKEFDAARLCQAIRKDRRALQRYREERREAVRQYVGSHWSEAGSSTRVPVNLLALYVRIVSTNLIAKNPRFLLQSRDRRLAPTISAVESYGNQQLERMHLQETLQRCVVDALFSVGICKVALATPADSATMAWTLSAGTVFASTVDLDDFVFDTRARDFTEASYLGHRIRVPLDAVKDEVVKIHGGSKDGSRAQCPGHGCRVGRCGQGDLADTNTEECVHDAALERLLQVHPFQLLIAVAFHGTDGWSQSTIAALEQESWILGDQIGADNTDIECQEIDRNSR
jgi:hypothetical protein